MRHLSKSLFTGFACAILMLCGSGVAFAYTTHVEGKLDRSGALVKYDYTRTHQYNGPITLSVDTMPSGYLRLGLRNMKKPGGPQFTGSIQWNKNGTKSWNGIQKNTRFAFQGRMKPCSFWCWETWGGDLTY